MKPKLHERPGMVAFTGHMRDKGGHVPPRLCLLTEEMLKRGGNHLRWLT